MSIFAQLSMSPILSPGELLRAAAAGRSRRGVTFAASAGSTAGRIADAGPADVASAAQFGTSAVFTNASAAAAATAGLFRRSRRETRNGEERDEGNDHQSNETNQILKHDLDS